MLVTRLLNCFGQSVKDKSGKISGKRLTAMTATGLLCALVFGLFFGVQAPDAAWYALASLAGLTAGASVLERRF